MINRFTLAAIAAAFALSGCAKHSVNEPSNDFATGATLLNVTHVPARTSDGATVYVTVDGNDAGALPYGESMQLHVPAGKHKVGGYARSIIGRVTIAPVEITTSGNTAKHVAYTVTKSKPNFTQLADEPLPQTPVAKAEPQSPVAAAQTAAAESPAAAATTETQTTTTATPAATSDTQTSTTVTPAATTETQATSSETPASAGETQATATDTQPQVVQTQATEKTESTETSATPQG